MKWRACVLVLSFVVAVCIAESASAYYNTSLGRFVSRDPIGYDGSKSNLYEYVGGRPFFYVDPNGLEMIRPPHVGPPYEWPNEPYVPPQSELNYDFDTVFNKKSGTECIFETVDTPKVSGYDPADPPGIYKPGIKDASGLPGGLRHACGQIPANTCDRITLSGHGIAGGCGIRTDETGDVFGIRCNKKSPDFDHALDCLESRLKPGGYVRICSCAHDESSASACAQTMADQIQATVCYCHGDGTAPRGILQYCQCVGTWVCKPPTSMSPWPTVIPLGVDLAAYQQVLDQD